MPLIQNFAQNETHPETFTAVSSTVLFQN